MTVRFDPRTGLILLVLVNIISFTFQEPWLEIVLIGFLAALQILCGCGKLALKWLSSFFILLLIQYLLLPSLPKVLAVTMTIFTVFARKLFPCFMMGSLIIQITPARHFIIALRKWHVPQTLIIPLAVTLRYFPAINEEHCHIRDAMKLKQIHSFKQKIECTMLPLLISAIQTADELSAAAITRGIENPCRKTCVEDLRFCAFDWLCLGVTCMLTLISIFFA